MPRTIMDRVVVKMVAATQHMMAKIANAPTALALSHNPSSLRLRRKEDEEESKEGAQCCGGFVMTSCRMNGRLLMACGSGRRKNDINARLRLTSHGTAREHYEQHMHAPSTSVGSAVTLSLHARSLVADMRF
jgi:hypothetical protein